jgi:uncharacterized damage-inducible protein DinB
VGVQRSLGLERCCQAGDQINSEGHVRYYTALGSQAKAPAPPAVRLEVMNYYGGKELADSFRTVRKNTVKIAEEIPEEHYGFRAAPDTRTVAQTLTHIAVTPMWADHFHAVERRTTMVGFDFPGFFAKIIAEEQKPRSKAELVSLLQADGERLAKWMDGLSDDVLGERVTLPPGMTPASKSRFEMLLGLKEHEMHHRAQLMLIERLLGIVPHMTRDMQARMAAQQATKASAS